MPRLVASRRVYSCARPGPCVVICALIVPRPVYRASLHPRPPSTGKEERNRNARFACARKRSASPLRPVLNIRAAETRPSPARPAPFARLTCRPCILYGVVVVREAHVSQAAGGATPTAATAAAPAVRAADAHALAEGVVALGTDVLGVARQHALNRHADAFDALDGRPACRAEEVETDDAVGVDVGVNGDRASAIVGWWGR